MCVFAKICDFGKLYRPPTIGYTDVFVFVLDEKVNHVKQNANMLVCLTY